MPLSRREGPLGVSGVRREYLFARYWRFRQFFDLLLLGWYGLAHDTDSDQSRPISRPQNDSVDEGHQQPAAPPGALSVAQASRPELV